MTEQELNQLFFLNKECERLQRDIRDKKTRVGRKRLLERKSAGEGGLTMTNPCINCKPPTRNPGCHDRCAQRAEWLKQEEDRKTMIKTAKKKDNEYRYYQIENGKGA